MSSRQAEVDRIEAERKRTEDLKHTNNVKFEALEAIMQESGVDEAIGRLIVIAIADGRIPHVSIRY